MSRMISLSGKAGNCLHLLHQTSLLRCMQPSSSGRCSFLPFAFCPSSPKFESLAEAMYRFHFPAHFDQAAYYSDAEGSAGMSFTGITCLSRFPCSTLERNPASGKPPASLERLIGGFVTPALTGRAELRSQRFGNYPLTQQPTTAQMHTYTHTHIHGLHVNTSEMGRQAVCVFHLLLFHPLHICLSRSFSLSPSCSLSLSLSLISRMRS
ncbi:uncharacterized protein LOC122999389 isoform X1 [Thunnus albacares]|uniref:uncharacterized protein LOC122999389 isoform X1 n=1 Tax=Thunnus albacares TaxID=8236 RepID=UPI001CF67387|nr:uncharacterized protein LOC122999389 isoform X1 [Thunnus albacares]